MTIPLIFNEEETRRRKIKSLSRFHAIKWNGIAAFLLFAVARYATDTAQPHKSPKRCRPASCSRASSPITARVRQDMPGFPVRSKQAESPKVAIVQVWCLKFSLRRKNGSCFRVSRLGSRRVGVNDHIFLVN